MRVPSLISFCACFAAFLSILLADVTSGILGLVTSTSLIVIFGEIVPQSLCSRHGLYIGAKTIYITWFFVIILFPLAWPISKALDLVSLCSWRSSRNAPRPDRSESHLCRCCPPKGVC